MTQVKGTPSKKFGHRGLYAVSWGNPSTPIELNLYDANKQLKATLTQEKGVCIDEGYVDFFESPACRGARYASSLVEILPSGEKRVLHKDPDGLAANNAAWLEFLDNWIKAHGQ